MDTKVEPEKIADKKPKKPLWKRIVKGLLWFLGGTLVFVLVAVLTLPLWINPVATSLAKSLVPGYTGTAFDIKDVELNPYTGKMLISGVKLDNPKGYDEAFAFKLGKLTVDVEVSSLLSKTIHVRDITIDAPFASYVFDAEGVNNFDRIIEAVNKKLGPKKEKKDEKPSETKVVIDKVTITNVKVAVGNGRFELASLVVTDFGKETPAKIEISGVKLVNPSGFEAENAFSLNSLAIGVETGDLAKLPIKIQEIVIDSPYASYVFDEKNVDNFTRMLEPLLAQGGKPEKGPKKEKKAEEKKAGPSGTPVTVDRLEVKNLKTHVCNGRFEFDSLVVTDFGKPTVATVTLEGVKLVNPDGFKTPNAFSLGSLTLGMDLRDLGKPPFKIQEIVIDSPYASYVFDEKNVDNFTRMLEPLLAQGGKPEKEPKKEKKAEEKKAGPSGTPVTVDRLEVKNLKTHVCNGRFEFDSLVVTDFGKATNTQVRLENVNLANPEGFAGPNAFSLKSLSVGLETADLSKKPMVFHDIIVDSPYAGVFINGDWELNFKSLFKPLMGDKKGGEKEKKVAADEKKDKEKKKDEDAARVVIDKLAISGTKIQFDSPIPVLKGTIGIPLPTFTDIGKDSKDGAKVKEVGEKILEKVEELAGPLGGTLDKIVRNPSLNMKELISVDAMKAFGNAKNFVSVGATNILGGAKGKLGDAVGNTKNLIGGFIPGGDKKENGTKKEDGKPGALDKAADGVKGALDKVNPANLWK